MTMPELPTAVPELPLSAEAQRTRVATPDFARFLNVEHGVIGRTVSTKFEPNTSSRFLFWLGDQEKVGGGRGESGGLEIGNIVAARATDDDDVTFGTVVEMRSYSDVDSFIADYLSHNFGDASVEIPTDVSEVVVVTCEVMRNLCGKTKPIGSSQVYYPSSLGIEFSYGIVDAEGNKVFTGAAAAIPIGLFENGDGTVAPISVDEDFLVGPESAHLNVSGISGLAAKTSAVEFILKSLVIHTGKRLAVVMFNVKSRDLLYVDQANPQVQDDAWSMDAYKALDVPPEPFKRVRFFAPGHATDPNRTQSLRTLPTTRFSWDLQLIKNDIPSLFDSEDWDDKMEGVWFRIADEIDQRPLNTYGTMLTWIEQLIRQAVQQQNMYPQGHHVATWQKMRSRLARFPRAYAGLILNAGQGSDIPWSTLNDDSVFVIDIQMLADRAKKLVFGRAMREISELMEDEHTQLDAVVVFVDELNKFAPSGSVRTPLKSRLIDITARGRSIGVVLFGAEQFASSVEKEIVENSTTFLFGRTEANELRAPNYSGFSDEVKAKLSMLPQGQLLAKSAKYPQPIFVRFPFPPCLAGDKYGGV